MPMLDTELDIELANMLPQYKCNFCVRFLILSAVSTRFISVNEFCFTLYKTDTHILNNTVIFTTAVSETKTIREPIFLLNLG